MKFCTYASCLFPPLTEWAAEPIRNFGAPPTGIPHRLTLAEYSRTAIMAQPI
jgi:hypothetical protein